MSQESINLMQDGEENLISRSQAKRLIQRFERFKEVILDFSGVEFIGQGFADEVFRVFKNAHPDIELLPVNTSPNVARMIAHAAVPDQGPLAAPQIRHPQDEHPI